MIKKKNIIALSLLVLVFVISGIINFGTDLYVKWLWFDSLKLSQVFTTIFITEVLIKVVLGIFFFLVLFISLLFTKKAILSILNSDVIDLKIGNSGFSYRQLLTNSKINTIFLGISLLWGYMMSSFGDGSWEIVKKYFNPVMFNVNDPLFGNDISFYVFKLPFYELIYKTLTFAIITNILAVGFIYLIIYGLNRVRNFKGKAHLSILLAGFFLLKAWGYRLSIYELLQSPRGVAYGASYTDIHANLPAYQILSIIALICAVVLIANIFLRRFRIVVASIGILIGASIILNGIYPAIIQSWRVVPNEPNLERPYITNNITFTNQAYLLNKIEKKNFNLADTDNINPIKNDEATIKNIRLWDWQPLQKTYSQLQEIRNYYTFKDIDIDRYLIDGEYRQVMLAARELDQNQLPEQAKIWVNQHLKYTHGYGVAMSPVNEVTTEGLPKFFLQDIPPKSNANIKVDRPEIYFGEVTDNYVIVNTNTKEFNYPKGDQNVYSNFQGKDGLSLGNFFKRALFAYQYGDLKFLLASDINENSRLLLNRNISQRVREITPFLSFDDDPYLVINNNKLYWIQEGYTSTNMYPYAEPYDEEGHNYIRNSVKVVTDAYSGEVNYYISDDKDPIIKSYQKMFPNLFKNINEMPKGFREHIRYPEYLFSIQAKMFSTYHMEDPQVFYGKEDKWSIPNELFGNESQGSPMEPYYTIMKLPIEKKAEYILMLPFTPKDKDNMSAWMAARSDGENYGKLIVYQFPKQKLIYGPMQIENRINTDSYISQQLSLWNQRGSEVFRGNLIVLPINNNILYVEPLFLQAEASKMPELRRVIMVYKDQVVMEETMQKALQRVFGINQNDDNTKTNTGITKEPQTLSQLATKANQLFEDAQNKQKVGDWSGYGESLKQLNTTLKELNKLINHQ